MSNLLSNSFFCPNCGQKIDCSTTLEQYSCTNVSCNWVSTPENLIDLSYKGVGMQRVLSNLFPYDFKISGIKCSSMEGFLRSLVEPDVKVQKELCKLSGFNAYATKFALRDWRPDQTLYWKGKSFSRESKGYSSLIDKAYDKLFRKNALFKKFLLSTKGTILIHSIGSSDEKESLLTANQYISQLYRLRSKEKHKV